MNDACALAVFGTSGAVFALTATGLGGGSGAYSGGGVEGVEEALLSSDEELKLDFFLLSESFTIAICDGLDEFSMVTRASTGPLTFDEALRLRLGLAGRCLWPSSAAMAGGSLGCTIRLKSWCRARHVSIRLRSESCVRAW